jgi:hypothetical protein
MKNIFEVIFSTFALMRY